MCLGGGFSYARLFLCGRSWWGFYVGIRVDAVLIFI